jgi:hypothetical protein
LRFPTVIYFVVVLFIKDTFAMETASVTSLASKGPDEQLVIVLHVGEGIHFNVAEAVVIQSSLKGNKLESEPIKPGHTTLFDSNLIWETNRKSIKQLSFFKNYPCQWITNVCSL